MSVKDFEDWQDGFWQGVPRDMKLRNQSDRDRLSFWERAVLAALLDSGRVSCSLREAKQLPLLMKDGRSYLGLGRVMQELRAKGQCTALGDEETVGSPMGWAMNVIMSPVKLAGRLLLSSGDGRYEEVSEEERFFFPAVAERLGQVMVEMHGRGTLIDRALVPEEAAAYLVRRGQLARCGELGYKVGTPDAEDVDVAVLKVRHTRNTLRDREQSVIQRIEELKKEALENARAGRRERAKQLLKRKHMLEGNLSQLMEMTTNVESVALALEQAQLNDMAFGSLKAGSAALKQIRESAGLSEETVLQVIEEYEEELDKQKNIEDALHQQQPSAAFDMQELEAELAELAAEDGVDKIVLPSVPDTLPAKQKEEGNKKEAVLG